VVGVGEGVIVGVGVSDGSAVGVAVAVRTIDVEASCTTTCCGW